MWLGYVPVGSAGIFLNHLSQGSFAYPYDMAFLIFITIATGEYEEKNRNHYAIVFVSDCRPFSLPRLSRW